MKTQPREVYGYGPKLRTRRFPTAGACMAIIVVALLGGALWR